jgi:hypothetical protein
MQRLVTEHGSRRQPLVLEKEVKEIKKEQEGFTCSAIRVTFSIYKAGQPGGAGAGLVLPPSSS